MARGAKIFWGLGPPADVQEVGRLTAVILYEIHRGHRESGAVHAAADVAVELDECESRFTRGDFLWRLRRRIAQSGDLRPALELVVVNRDLGIERLNAPIWRADERIDLGERRADGVNSAVQLLHDVGGRARLLHVAVKLEAERQGLMWEQAIAWIDGEAVNLLGRLRGDFLDVDASRGTHHQHRPLRCAVDDDADVALRGDFGGGRSEEHTSGLPSQAN